MKVLILEERLNSLTVDVDAKFYELIDNIGLLDCERMVLDANHIDYDMDDDFSPLIEEYGLENELPMVEYRDKNTGGVIDAMVLSISRDLIVVVEDGEPLEDTKNITFEDLADLREKINLLEYLCS